MSYAAAPGPGPGPGFLFQPSVSLALPPVPAFGPGVLLAPRPEDRARSADLARSSGGSAFAPYSGPSASSPGFSSSHLPYGAEPRAAGSLGSFMSPGFDPSSGVSAPLDFHPFGSLGPYPYGDPAYRKNATRDATATLKAWLGEHRKNPYPTKGEKIMLAIVTKMTLTQVSTWFANARRRLKKENKMTWTPRNRSEDEDDEDNGELDRHDEDDDHERDNASRLPVSLGTSSCVLLCRGARGARGARGGDSSSSDTDLDFKDSGDQRGSSEAPPPHASPGAEPASSPPSKEDVDSCGATQGPNVAPKPKLWSLAEIATSAEKSRGGAPGRPPFTQGPALHQHLYYTSSFLPTYSGYGPLGPLGPLSGPGSTLNGLEQTMLQRADCQLRGHTDLQGPKRGLTHV